MPGPDGGAGGAVQAATHGGAARPASPAIAALVRAYYRALEEGSPLGGFYATDDEAGALGPPVKIGSGEGEYCRGHGAIVAAVDRVTATFRRNRLESRDLTARGAGDLGWFADQVWWSGEAGGEPFASLTRWTGICLRTPRGWRFLQLHVSEGLPE